MYFKCKSQIHVCDTDLHSLENQWRQYFCGNITMWFDDHVRLFEMREKQNGAMCFWRYAKTDVCILATVITPYLEWEPCLEVTLNKSQAACVWLQTLNICRQGRLLHFSNIYSLYLMKVVIHYLEKKNDWAHCSLLWWIKKCWVMVISEFDLSPLMQGWTVKTRCTFFHLGKIILPNFSGSIIIITEIDWKKHISQDIIFLNVQLLNTLF